MLQAKAAPVQAKEAPLRANPALRAVVDIAFARRGGDVRVGGVPHSYTALPLATAPTRSQCGMSGVDSHTRQRIHITCYLLLVSVEPCQQLRNLPRHTGAIDNK